MKKIISFVFLLFSGFCCASECEVIQGPFKIANQDYVLIRKSPDVNYPLSLYLKSDSGEVKIESYESEGGEPHVETVFFMTLRNKKNVLVLVSWEQKHFAEGINGKLYQVYGYKYKKGKLIINSLIRDDPNLSGVHGEFNGQQMEFTYRNAERIKKYLKKYNGG